MNLRYSPEHARIHDAVEGLTLSYERRHRDIYQDYDFDISADAQEAFQKIQESVDLEIPCAKLWFGETTELALSFARSRFLPDDITLKTFPQHLQSLDEAKIRFLILHNLSADAIEVSERTLWQLASGNGDDYRFLESLPATPDIKWQALQFLQNPTSVMQTFIDLVQRFLPLYQTILAKNQARIEAFEKHLAEGLEEQGRPFLQQMIRDSVQLEAKTLIAGMLFFRSRSVTIVFCGDEPSAKLFVFVGIDYEETVKNALDNNDVAISVFKNLADKTRFQILNLLREENLYGQQIAEKIGLKLATVSYHMNYLLASNLVKLEKVGQKGYYSLHKQGLKHAMDFIRQNFGLEP